MLRQLRNAIRSAWPSTETLDVAPQATIAEPSDLDPANILHARLIATERELTHIRSEFAQLQLHWAEVLDKLTAWAQRQATRDRRKMQTMLKEDDEQPEQLEAPQPPPRELSLAEQKQELRRRAAHMRGIA
jgi:hypothetical protein